MIQMTLYFFSGFVLLALVALWLHSSRRKASDLLFLLSIAGMYGAVIVIFMELAK